MARIEHFPQALPFGKYELMERISTGRMAEVFKARKSGVEGFEKILAVKKIFPHLSHAQPFISAFVEEAKLTVSLSHANIVQVLDLGQQDDAYFMAEEYVPGYDLGTCSLILEQMQKPFPVDIAVFMISEVAKGLDYAHRRKDYNFESLNIVHRDLCPSNILISFEGEVKISDFGISCALEAAGTANDDLRRRYLYASPEQARGEHLTASSDIFTLGLVLYTLLTGNHPYAHPDPRTVVSLAQHGNIRPIQELVDLPRALLQIVNSTLAVDPANRVDSAGTLYEELISYLFASGQKADNRSLSLFMQDLRIYEDMVFPHGNRPVAPGSQPQAPPPQPHAQEPAWDAHDGGNDGMEELDDDEFEELSLDELEGDGMDEVYAPPMAYAPSGEEDSPQAHAGGYDQGYDQGYEQGYEQGHDQGHDPGYEQGHDPGYEQAYPQGYEQGHDAPQEDASALPLDVAVQAHEVDGWLDALTAQLQRGQGVAVALTGALGHAASYLPDRLSERLHARGLHPIHLLSGADHPAIPDAFAARLVLHAAHMPDWTLLHSGDLPQRQRHLDQQGIDALASRGLGEEELTLAAHLIGLLGELNVGAHTRTLLAVELCARLLSSLAQERPCVLIVDQAQHLDPHSRALLSELAAHLPHLPVALLVAAGGDALGLPVLEVHTDEPTPDEELIIRGLEPEAAAVLTALAVAEQPLLAATLAEVLHLSPDAVQRALDALHQRRALRQLPDQRVALLNERLLSILTDELVVGALPDPAPIAEALSRLALRASLEDAPDAPLIGTVRVRLLAWQRRRDLAIQEALHHAARLDDAGWRDEAAEHLRLTYDTFLRAELGAPHLLAVLATTRARLDLSRLRVEDARAALQAALPYAAATQDTPLLLDLHLLAGRIALADDDPWSAFASFQEVRAAAQRNRLPLLLARARLATARWHLAHGSLREAFDDAHAATNLIDRYHLRERHPRLAVKALALAAEAAALRGQHHLAMQLAADLDALATHHPDPATLLIAGYLRATLLARSFDPVQAADQAEAFAASAADAGREDLQARLLRLAAQAAFEANDLQRARRLAEALIQLGAHHHHAASVRAGSDIASLVAVLTSTGDRALDALKLLQQGLTRAVERKASRDQLDAHLHLFRALNHLGSGADAEHHREEALRFGAQVGAGHVIAQLEAL